MPGWKGWVLEDNSSKKDLLAEAAWLERNSALGCLLGGFAHEMNNVFGRILGFSELAMEEDVSEETREFLTEVRDSILQMTEMSRWLGRFSRRRLPTAEILRVEEICEKVKRTLGPELKADDISLILDFKDELSSRVQADEVLITQALGQAVLAIIAVSEDPKAVKLDLEVSGTYCEISLALDGGRLSLLELKKRLQLTVPGSDVRGDETESAAGSDVRGDETESAAGSDIRGDETESAAGSDVRGGKLELETAGAAESELDAKVGAQTGVQTGVQTGARTGVQTGARTGVQTGVQAGAEKKCKTVEEVIRSFSLLIPQAIVALYGGSIEIMSKGLKISLPLVENSSD